MDVSASSQVHAVIGAVPWNADREVQYEMFLTAAWEAITRAAAIIRCHYDCDYRDADKYDSEHTVLMCSDVKTSENGSDTCHYILL